MGKIEDLERLQKLKGNGILTDEEFEKEKSIILNETSQNTANIEHKKVKPKTKLKEKRKQILCTIGIISLFLVGLYGATRHQIEDLITQHRLNSSTSSSTNSSTNQKVTEKKSKEQKIKLAYGDVCEALYNTRTLEASYPWEYTDTSDSSRSGSAGRYAYYNESQLYSGTSETVEEQNLRNNVYNLLMNRKSSTGGTYDMLTGSILNRDTNGNYVSDLKVLNIIAFIPGLNIETNNEGIVTSISFCSSIANESEPISYKTCPYENYSKKYTKKYTESMMDSIYVPKFTCIINIGDMMKDLNYKPSEFDIYEDFTIETTYTDIEFYSPQSDGSLKLEYTSKTGEITTIKFN